MKYLIVTLLSVIMISCGKSTSNESESEDAKIEAPTVAKDAFGTMPDGTQIDRYTLKASSGVQVQLITYGGIITSLMVPDKEGNLGDIVLGYDNLQGYLDSSPYFGAIIGRYGNRIAKGQFALDGETYNLATNNSPNHLHGGNVGFDKVVWQAEEVHEEQAAGVKLTYHSKDMEEGYPGNLEVTVTYLLHGDNSLSIDYQAETDKPTIVNLTNHSYFNMGPDSTILNHQLKLNADRFLPVDSTLIPTGELRPVKGTPFDFTTMKAVGKDINTDNQQLKFGGGYDHCWILNSTDEEMPLAAKLYEPKSGRTLEVYTVEPGIQFYSGNFLDGSITGKDGEVYPYRSGLCLETQHYPDSPNQPDFPSVVLKPGETYKTTTKLVFSTQK